MKTYPEWLSFGASGFGGRKAEAWWKRMTGQDGVGIDVDKATDLVRNGAAKIDCVAIRIKRDGKFWRPIDRLRSDGFAVDENLKLRLVEGRAAA